jgi:hypothetical protein
VSLCRHAARSVMGVVLAGAFGCGKRPPAPVPVGGPAPASSPAASAPIASAAPVGRLATPTAFELIASPTGGTLVWAPADRGAAALRRRELDASGALQAPLEMAVSSAYVAGEVADLAASWVGSRLALAWLERSGAAARVRAAWAGTSSPPFELGAAWTGPRSSRGNVVIAARADKALVFARGGEAPCIEAARHGCFAFGFHELEASRAVATGLPMSVPVPCTDNSAALAVVGERFHYGVCTETGGRPVTTLFSIQRDPEYARADPLLEGCTPAGTFVWRNAAWLVGDCGGGRRAARIGDDPQEFLDLHGLRLECQSGRLRIRALSLDLALDEPRSGLAPLLPPDVAQSGARAAWTGRALLVATSFAEELRVTRRTCTGDRLETATLLP